MAGLVAAGDPELLGTEGVVWRLCPSVIPPGLWSCWSDAPSLP